MTWARFCRHQSEQTSLQPLEEMLNRRFGMTDYVVSTDSGLASEDNRRYNMAEGRDYICVQSIPFLGKDNQEIVLAPEGWRILYCRDRRNREMMEEYSTDGIFNLNKLLKDVEDRRRAEMENPTGMGIYSSVC